jgi:hypothetical protein
MHILAVVLALVLVVLQIIEVAMRFRAEHQ